MAREALEVLDDPLIEWEYLPQRCPVLTPEHASQYDAICVFGSRVSRETVTRPNPPAEADRALRRGLRHGRRSCLHRAGNSSHHRAGRRAPAGGEQRDGVHAGNGAPPRNQRPADARGALEREGRLSRLRLDRQGARRDRRGQHRQGSVPAGQALGHGASGLRSLRAAVGRRRPGREDGGPGHAAARSRCDLGQLPAQRRDPSPDRRAGSSA